ncbi:hypothetical protein AQUCO_02200086v1 [Aquilegia coerulea]|uniref:FCP1 homology domain-containing protein n=1 Tax=Aquilegia coerulea TaxID=218851 RepID=A0A2G5DDX4_AQUCA|nr:hypothetical protein AQUCO_02200086v1 [Aquilegia coerulea]
MPALKMKTTTSMICSRDGNGLGVCQKSCKISKNSSSQVRISQQAENLQSSDENNQDFSANNDVSFPNNECDEVIDHDLFDGEIHHCQSRPSSGFGSSSDILEILPDTYSSDFASIFSHMSESTEVNDKEDFHNSSAVDYDHADVTYSKADNDDDNGSRNSCDYQTCNVSDFHISDMIVSSLPFDETQEYNDIIEVDPFPNHECLDHDMIFDMTGRYMILPFLEETVEVSNTHNGESCELATMNSDDACLYLAIQQMNGCDQEPEVNCHSVDPYEVDGSDPHMFIRDVADLSDVVPAFCPMLLPKETRKRKLVTLVLDLDETLVHSTLEHCNDADFTFSVFFNMKEHTVYVKRRPYLQTFLERVAQMFEIIIFTASQSTYAEKLLDILDPESRLISRRAYRESCVFTDGTYIKDLTVLGIDLAKVAIIDNSPQVFRLQVNNGIPIKSWFDDPSDCGLISLLPFLETLVDSDDVRPIIAKKFSNKE